MMKELFLEVFSDVEEDGVCELPIQSLLVLFVYKYCEQPPLFITFVKNNKANEVASYRVNISKILFDFVNINELDSPASICILPVIITCEGTTGVSGLCAVLRQILKTADLKHPLLGFKQSCLYACAESSLWTKFCEVDLINTVNSVSKNLELTINNICIPEDVGRFEMHMGEPVRIHNIQKQKQDLARLKGIQLRSGLPDSRLDLLMDLEHVYTEGPEMSLADLIIFPCLHLFLQYLGSVFLKQHLPLTYKWYENMLSCEKIVESLNILHNVPRRLYNEIHVSYIFPDVPKQSLYKSDPKRYKPRHRLYTRQEDITACLNIIKNLNIPVLWQERTFGFDIPFDWNSVPFDAQPEGGQLPEKRLERKSKQLENLTRAVLKIAKQGDRIVDFCSGSGHLGLILAHSLPRCTIVLLENKEESIGRARERAMRLKLSNIVFCQSNIDYFCGDFDIGVSLHACGVATDLVLKLCLDRNASFVSCPCCYGSIQQNHVLEYPRSSLYRNSALSVRDYLVIGHAADQTHDENNVKTNQGNICMGIIDTDRVVAAMEKGYNVYLSKLEPITCTPKNNLLIGIPMRKDK